MDAKTLKIALAVAIILLTAYALRKEILDRTAGIAIWKAGETKTGNRQTTTTQETQTSRDIAMETTTTLSPYALPECLQMKTACKKDRCYFGNAINRQNTKLCEQIVDERLKNVCLNNLNNSQTTDNAVIEGQVFNTRYCDVYPELQVELKDEAENKTLFSTQTNSIGEYQFQAAPGKDYGIYVAVGEQTLNQNVTNLRKGWHIIDFALS
ncbi:MAG: hypothetical protein FJY77_04435 [Candidatus Altiarchaeales archaeon]|nr:hypothetical protein [Candidatus Altiarchaeales archaeon]